MKAHFLLPFLLAAATAGVAQTAPVAAAAAAQIDTLSLPQAQAAALRQRPFLHAALANASAANQVTSEVRSQLFPQLTGSLTAVGAENNSRIAAGGLNNPVIYDRYANGFSLSQQITDFGRTHSLEQSARANAESQQQDVVASRSQVLLEVDEAYFRALQAQAVLAVALNAVDERQVIAHQVGILAQNKLRSTLDVSFAEVNLAQARLLESEARNQVASSFADLALAMGTSWLTPPHLGAAAVPAAPDGGLPEQVATALRMRPELAAAGFAYDAARAYAQAQADLSRPTFSAVAAAGLTPTGSQQLPDRYAAAGVNLSIPLFNGGKFGAEHREAEFQATARQQQMDELRNQIEHDVQVAWLNQQTAEQQLSLTAKLQQQAALALQLAQSRYQIGLGSIVELSQAQLNQTQADIAAAQAQFQSELTQARLRFQVGLLR